MYLHAKIRLEVLWFLEIRVVVCGGNTHFGSHLLFIIYFKEIGQITNNLNKHLTQLLLNVSKN